MEKPPYQKIILELDQMFKKDQEAVLDPKDWKKFKQDPNGLNKHTQKIKEIINVMGWPTISKVGSDACSQAWFLVQHSDHDVQFQKEVLKLLKSLPEGEVSKVNIAMLEDRVRKNEGRPQLYGSQWIVKENVQVPYQIEDPEHVEERRRQMGMDTMADNLQHLQEWSKMVADLRSKKRRGR